MKAFDYLLLPFVLLALFAGAEIFLMTKPMEGHIHLYYNVTTAQRFQDTRLSVENLSSQVKTMMDIVIYIDRGDHIVFVVDVLTDNRTTDELEKQALHGRNLFGGLGVAQDLALLTERFIDPDLHHPQKVVPQVIYIVSALSFALFKELKFSCSRPLFIKTVGSGSAAAMLAIGFLAARFLFTVSLLDLIIWNVVGTFTGWMIICWAIPYYFRDTIGVNDSGLRETGPCKIFRRLSV